MKARAPHVPDLFGDRPDDDAGDRDATVDLVLVLIHQTDRAWLLRRAGGRPEGRWLAKSLATRGDGDDRDVWSLPRWIAAERGWL